MRTATPCTACPTICFRLPQANPLSAPLPRPNRHGWRFSRWTTADGSDVPAVMPAENLTLKAVWQAKTPHTLTLLYIIDGEPETYPIEQTTLFENDFIVLPDLSDMPHLADYTLRAWTRAAATDLDAQLPQLMPDEDITLLAHLTLEKPEGETYTVTYDTQCALTVAPRTVAPVSADSASRSRRTRRLSLRRLVSGFGVHRSHARPNGS